MQGVFPTSSLDFDISIPQEITGVMKMSCCFQIIKALSLESRQKCFLQLSEIDIKSLAAFGDFFGSDFIFDFIFEFSLRNIQLIPKVMEVLFNILGVENKCYKALSQFLVDYLKFPIHTINSCLVSEQGSFRKHIIGTLLRSKKRNEIYCRPYMGIKCAQCNTDVNLEPSKHAIRFVKTPCCKAITHTYCLTRFDSGFPCNFCNSIMIYKQGKWYASENNSLYNKYKAEISRQNNEILTKGLSDSPFEVVITTYKTPKEELVHFNHFH